MAERKLNIDIEKSVAELEGIAKEINLDISKKDVSPAKKLGGKSSVSKEPEKKLSLMEKKRYLKKWKNILNVFLIFSIFMFVFIIIIMSFYYKEEIQGEEEIIPEGGDYAGSAIHLTSRLDNSSFYLADLSRISDKNVQGFIIVKEGCVPNISCRYIGYVRKYDLLTIFDEEFLLDKNVIDCYDSSDCVSNFTYLESSGEPFSRQKIKIEKEGENMLNVYNEDDTLIAKLEKRDLGYFEKLYVWFEF